MNVPSTPSGPPRFEFKPTRQPLLWAALAYSLGIVASAYLWWPVLWWVAAALAFLPSAAFFAYRGTWLAYGIARGVFFFAGALHVQVQTASPPLDTAIQPFADGREFQITGHVTQDGRLRQASFGKIQQTTDVETEAVKTETEQTISVHSGIRLNIYAPQVKDAGGVATIPAAVNGATEHSMRLFRYGERIRFFAKLRPPRNSRNPGAFDYEGYLAANGIAPRIGVSDLPSTLLTVGSCVAYAFLTEVGARLSGGQR
jgi:predicted membrane metal-binding protein